MSAVRLAMALSWLMLVVCGEARAKPLHVARVTGDGAGLAYWSPAGDSFLVQSRDGEALVEYRRDGRSVGRISLEAAHQQLMFDLGGMGEKEMTRPMLSPNGKTFLLVDGNFTPWRLDVGTGKIAPLDAGRGMVSSMIWLPDGKHAMFSWFDGSNSRQERIEVASGHVEHSCRSPYRLGAQLLDDEHVVVLADQLYAMGFDCEEPLALTAPDGVARGQAIAVALAPSRHSVAVLLSPSQPTPGSHQGLWIYARANRKWTAVRQDAFIASSFAWLDDDTLLFEELRGPDGSDSGTLQRYSIAAHKVDVAVPPVAGCVESGLSAPSRGGVVTFQRLCVREDGWMGMVTR